MKRTWQRNLQAIWIAELLALMGFGLISPILPYYVKTLGGSGKDVEIWTGIVASAPFFAMGLFGPIWGMAGDRYGRKLMVERAMFGGVVINGLMGLSQNVEQLAVLRVLQGALTGTVAAATTLVASTTPRERLGETLGQLQVGIFLGQSLGPLVGGYLSDRLGYRAVFLGSCLLLLLAGGIVLTQVHEAFAPLQKTLEMSRRGDWAVLLGSLLGIVLLLRFALRLGIQMTSPMLPLWVEVLLPSGGLIGSASGLLITVSGLASAVSAPLVGRLADRYGGRLILLVCAALAAGSLTFQGILPNYGVLLVLQVISGIAIGGTLSVISAYVGRLSPEGREGAAYGLDALAGSTANALGPLAGGWIGRLSLPAVFLAGGGVTALAGFLVLGLPRESRGER